MANRIKVVCTRILKTENILHGSPGALGSEYAFSHPGAVSPSVTLLGNFPTEFELGKEYNIDFSKVIATRKTVQEEDVSLIEEYHRRSLDRLPG